MARAELAPIITEVKTLVGNADWFTDDQVQSALDRHRFEHNHTRLNAQARFNSSGQHIYTVWDTPSYLEAPTFTDIDYATLTPDTTNYINGRVEFSSSQDGQYLLLNGYEHDIYSAAADLLDIRAAQKVEDLTSFSGVNGSYSRALSRESLEAKAESYRKRAKVRGGDYEALQVVDVVRNDLC